MSRLPVMWAMTKAIRARPVRAITYLLPTDVRTGRNNTFIKSLTPLVSDRAAPVRPRLASVVIAKSAQERRNGPCQSHPNGNHPQRHRETTACEAGSRYFAYFVAAGAGMLRKD